MENPQATKARVAQERAIAIVGRVLTNYLYLLGLLLYHIGASERVRSAGRKNPKVLLYHDCSESETEYTSGLECTTSPARFRQHIDYLSKHYNVVDLDSLIAGEAPSGSVSLTFDDGYASVYSNVFPFLQEKEFSATVYLVSDVVDNGRMVWVNELNYFLKCHFLLTRGRVAEYFPILPGDNATAIISCCRLNYSPGEMRVLLEDLRREVALDEQKHAANAHLYLTWDQIRTMQQAGFAFGNHTRTHPNMARLSRDEQLDEISQAQAELERHVTGVVSFAHPFGHRGSSAIQLASEVGLKSAVDVGGYNRPLERLSVARVHLSNESLAGLFARTEVVEPVKGLLRSYIQKLRAGGGTSLPSQA